MRTNKADRVLIKSTRNLDELTRLLDEGLDPDCLPKYRPLRPSQVDKLVTKSFQSILCQLHLLRLELLQKHSNINDIRLYSKELLDKQSRRSKKVIDPRSVTVPRSIAVFDKRLEFIEDLFSEVLQLYERQTGKPWIPDGSVK